MGMTPCDLNDNLDCSDDIHQGKFSIIYASAEAAVDKINASIIDEKQKIRYLVRFISSTTLHREISSKGRTEIVASFKLKPLK